MNSNWAETADKIVRATIESHLDEYNSTQKVIIQKPTFGAFSQPIADSGIRQTKLEEYKNYFHFDQVSEEDFEAEVLSKVAREIAFTVDLLVRRQAQKSGAQWKLELKRLSATDLFMKADGNPNLKLYFVKDAPTYWNPADPFRQMRGWISYKFLFACG